MCTQREPDNMKLRRQPLLQSSKFLPVVQIVLPCHTFAMLHSFAENPQTLQP